MNDRLEYLWVSVKELSILANVPARTIKYGCKKNRYGVYQQEVRGNGGRQYRISLESPLVPLNVKAKVFAQMLAGSIETLQAAERRLSSAITSATVRTLQILEDSQRICHNMTDVDNLSTKTPITRFRG